MSEGGLVTVHQIDITMFALANKGKPEKEEKLV